MPINGTRTLTDRDGAAFIQPDGPNSTVIQMECVGAGDVAEDFGSTELTQAFGSGGEYITKGAKVGAPGVVTFDLTRLVTKDATWLEDLRDRQCFVPIYLKQQDCGQLSDFNNYVRMLMIEARLKTFTFQGFKAIGNEGEKEAMFSTSWEGLPPVLLTNATEISSMTQSNANQVNDITFNTDEECDSNCEETYAKGQRGVAVFNSTGGAKPKIRLTTDYGVTWADAAADPGAVDDDLAAVVRFQINSTVRILVGKTAPAGAQGQIFYSDDNGATYSTVSIGGGTAGHGAVDGKCLYVPKDDPYFLWLASAAGYLYKSTDGGVSWTAKESAVLGSGDYHFVHFAAGKKYGLAGQAGDVIAITNNGGDSWSAATATGGGGDILCGWRLDKSRLWVGTDDGDLFYSTDGGTSWTERAIPGSPAQVRDMMWLDPWNGLILTNTAGPVGTVLRTVDGGQSWKAITTPTNAGLNSVWFSSLNRFYACGQPQGSLGVILRGQPNRVG